jgi:hypothetical protein
MKWWIFLLLVACACPSKKPSVPATASGEGSGAHTGSDAVAAASTCEGARSKVEQLYRAEAQTKEPKRVEDAVADNTKMVMNDCAKDPAKVVPCLASVQSVADLEKQCLVPLDDEGTENEPQTR